jgi:hypothetical protein
LEALGLLCFIFQFIEFLFAVPNREQLLKIDRSRATAAPLLPVCAVANAIGKWIAPPVTPDKILRALGKG